MKERPLLLFDIIQHFFIHGYLFVGVSVDFDSVSVALCSGYEISTLVCVLNNSISVIRITSLLISHTES